MIYGLVGQHLSVLITSQACQTLFIHPQDICNWWQHTHGMWFQVITHITMMMTWWFCISYQIWPHSLGWMASQRIDCVSGVLGLVHAPNIYVEWLATYPWSMVSYNNTHHNDDVMVVLQILPNLVPQLGCYVARNNIIPVYWLCSRIITPFPCTYKKCGMGGSTSMITFTLYHIQELPGDSLVVFQIIQNPSPSYGGLWPGWRAYTCIGCIPGL